MLKPRHNASIWHDGGFHGRGSLHSSVSALTVSPSRQSLHEYRFYLIVSGNSGTRWKGLVFCCCEYRQIYKLNPCPTLRRPHKRCVPETQRQSSSWQRGLQVSSSLCHCFLLFLVFCTSWPFSPNPLFTERSGPPHTCFSCLCDMHQIL